MRWVIYRIHYGLDFLKQSIDSIKDDVDKIFVVYSMNPWIEKEKVTYLGETIKMPFLHENVEQFMYDHYQANQKIVWFSAEFNSPKNQFRQLYDLCRSREIYKPDTVLFMEPDMLFYKPLVSAAYNELSIRNLPCLSFQQIELWKTSSYRVPQRDRLGPTIWKIDYSEDFSTHFGTYAPEKHLQHQSNHIQVYNFGFCLNAQTMFYKHLTAINFSRVIGDSIPSHEWYRDKWLNWDIDTEDLEIAQNYKSNIKKILPFNMPKEMHNQLLGII
jgi:hypothetical protein